MAKPWIVGAVAFVGGGLIASGAWTAFPPSPESRPARATKDPATSVDDSQANALATANANLTSSLQECDRRLSELGEHPVGVPAPAEPDAGRRERRQRPEFTAEDWQRMADAGMIPTRVPCIRDKPWTPTDRAVEGLGLAPSDIEAISAAYVASNKRMNEHVRPLCVTALGSAKAVDEVGISGCIDVIASTARKASGADTKAALGRVAEVQMGKRSAAGNDAPAVEQLGNILLKESKSFEDDLAQKLGPDEAKRVALSPDLCMDRKVLRAPDADVGDGGGGRRNRDDRGDRGNRGDDNGGAGNGRRNRNRDRN